MEKHLYEWGNRENTTLVFFHGLGSTGLSFGELAKYLPEYHVISFDIAGHGRAKPLLKTEDYQPTHMVEEIGKIVKELDKPKFFLIGHSWGAHLALYFAKAYPKQIQGVILLDGGYLPINEIGSLQEELKNIEEFYNSVRFPSWEAFIESEKSEIPRWSDELEEASRAQVAEVDGEIRLVTTKFTAKSVIKGIYAEPTDEILSDIAPPTLLLRSTHPIEMGSLRKKASEHFQLQIPDAAVHAIPNTSHDIYRDAPKEVAENIKSWIRNVK